MLKERLLGNEKVVVDAHISKAAIIIDWLLFPFILLLFFLTVCLPCLGSIYSSVEKINRIASILGVEEIDFIDLLVNMGTAFRLPKFLIIFIDILLALLVVCWFGWACVKTYLHFGYELLATDKRLMVRSKGEYLESKWDEIKNVFVAQSIWGKFLGYGTVTVHSARGAITVKSITSPYKIQQEFYSRTSDNFI